MREQDTTAIKCKECGAPSYFDQKSEGFICPYCGSVTPWASADYRYTWVTDLRRHKYASVNLPVWYLDKASWAGESDLQIRMAVNAQTGKAAVLFLEAEKKDYTRTLESYSPPKMSDECTMYSPPLPVKYVKSPFLFKICDEKEVLGKPRSKFRMLFKD